MARPEIVVVGAGLVGLATARALSRPPYDGRVTLLEKEAGPVRHQSGHNSGVIHSGVYYRPGSLKARLTLHGRSQLLAFCEAKGLPHRAVGKVILATTPREIDRLDGIAQRGVANGVPNLRFLDPGELRAIEPYARALRALHVPSASIVDYVGVGHALVEDLRAAGVEIAFEESVLSARAGGDRIEVVTTRGTRVAHLLVNCSGLHSDRVARRCGAVPRARIVPFRGEYYLLRPEAAQRIRGLIYPVPDPELPFLGVHLTRTMDERVEAGPNAILALAREGYDWKTLRSRDLAEVLLDPGFLRLARRFGATGLFELHRSLSRSSFLASLRRLVPDLVEEDLTERGSGVRAQAIAPDGSPLDDFVFAESPRALHVVNAPSPAATASLAIGAYIAERAWRALAGPTSP